MEIRTYKSNKTKHIISMITCKNNCSVFKETFTFLSYSEEAHQDTLLLLMNLHDHL